MYISTKTLYKRKELCYNNDKFECHFQQKGKDTMTDHFVITIARQYGSGGREIGLRVAELLGIKSYDKELITMAAQKSGLNTNVAHHADEKATNSLLYTLAMGKPYEAGLFIRQSPLIIKK